MVNLSKECGKNKWNKMGKFSKMQNILQNKMGYMNQHTLKENSYSLYCILKESLE